MQGLLVTLLLAATGLGAAATEGDSGSLCFNQLQVLGTHNSYHQAPPQELLAKFGGLTAGPLQAWQYSQPGLTAQLDTGVRSFELDAYWDPAGGVYAQAAGLRIAGQPGFLADPKYKQPGFKVLHVPDFDFRTSCILLTDCLSEIKGWSDAHPRHLPIRVHLEVKQTGQVAEAVGPLLLGVLQGMLDASTAEGPTKFIQEPRATAQTFLDLQSELEAVFGAGGGGRLLTPREVRQAVGLQAGADLAAALLQAPGSGQCPWPSLDSMRGKVIVTLILNGGSDMAARLQEAFPNPEDSLAWPEQNGRTALPGAVFRSRGTWGLGEGLGTALPADADQRVADMVAGVVEAVQAGYIVRARADSDTVEARAGYTGRRDAMFASGAQVVASDFVLPAAQHRAAGSAQALFSTDYRVALPGGLAGRCLLPNVTSSGASAAAVRLDAFDGSGDGSGGSGEDAIYCGTLEAALDSGGSGGGVALPTEQPSGGLGGSTTQDPATTPTEQQDQQPETAQTNGSWRPTLPAALAAAAGLLAAALAAL